MIVNSNANTALSTYASTAARTTGTTDTNRVASDKADSTSPSASAASVKLSSTSTDYSQSIASYAAYFPTRSGMSADALGLGVSQPGAVSSSKDKTFDDVAADARKRLDDRYALMTKSGTPYDGSDTDRNSLMGDLDRRSLYAVATNQGGTFSANEQAAAKGLMQQQGRLATGYFSGPADQQKYFTDPYANDPVGRAKAALSFLDNMSTEEKAGPQWLSQHQTLSDALAQTGSSGQDATKKPDGHFHNLWEILAGIDTSGSQSEKSASDDSNPTSTAFEKAKAALQASQ